MRDSDLFIEIATWLAAGAVQLWQGRSSPEEPPLRRFAAPALADGPEQEAERRRRGEFARSFASLLAAVARADGVFANEEWVEILKLLQRQLGLTAGERDAVQAVLRDLAGDGTALARAAALCREQLEVPERVLLLDALYAVASADGEFTRREQGAIREVAALLGLDAAAQRSALARNRGLAAVCYEVLGVHPGATDEEVNEAYLRLMAESQSMADRRSEIDTAYQQIRELRGG